MVVAAVGSVLSAMPLGELVSPLESLITSRVQRFQQLAEEQVSTTYIFTCLSLLVLLNSLCLLSLNLRTMVYSLHTATEFLRRRFFFVQPSILSHPLVVRELTILSALCHHICPMLLNGEQHPVSAITLLVSPAFLHCVRSSMQFFSLTSYPFHPLLSAFLFLFLIGCRSSCEVVAIIRVSLVQMDGRP